MNLPLQTDTSPEQVQARMAYEMAARLSDPKDILARYGLNANQAKKLFKTPQFKQLYREAKAVWEADTSVKERIRAKAAMMVEDSLLEVFGMVHNTEIAAPSRLDAFKQIMQVADLGPKRSDSDGASGPHFSLTLNLGHGMQQRIEAQAIDGEAEVVNEAG